MEHSYKTNPDGFVWSCCRMEYYAEGCKTGSHVAKWDLRQSEQMVTSYFFLQSPPDFKTTVRKDIICWKLDDLGVGRMNGVNFPIGDWILHCAVRGTESAWSAHLYMIRRHLISLHIPQNVANYLINRLAREIDTSLQEESECTSKERWNMWLTCPIWMKRRAHLSLHTI